MHDSRQFSDRRENSICRLLGLEFTHHVSDHKQAHVVSVLRVILQLPITVTSNKIQLYHRGVKLVIKSEKKVNFPPIQTSPC